MRSRTALIIHIMLIMNAKMIKNYLMKMFNFLTGNKAYKFQILKSDNDTYWWELKDDNNQKIAVSSIKFNNLHSCRKSIGNLIEEGPFADIEMLLKYNRSNNDITIS